MSDTQHAVDDLVVLEKSGVEVRLGADGRIWVGREGRCRETGDYLAVTLLLLEVLRLREQARRGSDREDKGVV